jgi:ABC-type glycerol-3-phosphate transport system substrate-binding protein
MKNVSTRKMFKPLDGFFKDNPSVRNAFYPRLLAAGNIDGKQYLLPVSFNAPVVIFEKNKGEQLSSPFTIDFNEMKNIGKAYNTSSRGVYTRMGFSPSWDDNFLYIIAVLFNTSFREDTPLEWDAAALERAIQFADEWNREANTGIHAVEDFSFKYFYTPSEKLAQSGRILFTYMDSDSFFTIAEDQRNTLDFRWLTERDIIPLAERSVFIGLVKKGKSPKAANAFLHWFFQTETQHGFLEKSHVYRLNETSFGISGGFSALRPVTELVFPRFYPGLLGRMPPEDFLTPANILPGDWTEMKERVILPYLHDKVRQPDGDVNSLERRLADWVRARR